MGLTIGRNVLAFVWLLAGCGGGSTTTHRDIGLDSLPDTLPDMALDPGSPDEGQPDLFEAFDAPPDERPDLSLPDIPDIQDIPVLPDIPDIPDIPDLPDVQPEDEGVAVDEGVAMDEGGPADEGVAVDEGPMVEPLSVIAVTPSVGFAAGGNLVAVKGTGFLDGATVTFGQKPAVQVTVGGPSLLTCLAPAGEPGIVDVAVKLTDGREAVLQAAYEYLAQESLSLTAVSPASGPAEGGEVVVITGTGFEDGAIVSFGETPASLASLASPHVLVVTTPGHEPGLVDVTVRLPDGTNATLAQAYEFLPPGVQPLRLDSVTPGSGPASGGTLVVVKGQGFAAGAKVLFGDLAAGGVTVENAELITCTTPASPAMTVDVTVTLPDGQSVTLPAAFTFTEAEKLSLTAVSPSKGPVAGGPLVMLTGTGFEPGLTAFFGESEASNVSVAGPHIAVCPLPPHVVGTVDVTVRGPGGNEATLAQAFTYEPEPVETAKPPEITSAWPKQGPTTGGTPVLITGTNFREECAVSFGAISAAKVTRIDATRLLAVAPAAAPGVVALKVTNPDGQSATLNGAFKYVVPTQEPPSISEIWPNSGPSTGGTPVRLGGAGFQAGARVLFGALQADPTVVKSSTLALAFTPMAEEGAVDVTIVNPDGQYDTVFGGFSFFTPGSTGGQPPLIGGVTPGTGAIEGGETVTVSGVGFVTGMRVYFGTNEAQVLSLQYGSLARVLTPPGSPGAVDVIAVNPDGYFAKAKAAFVYFEAPPFIAAVEPSSGIEAGGYAVRLKGKNFRTGAQVRFADILAGSVVDSATQITVTVPPNVAGMVDVSVTNPSGLSDTLMNGFEYVTKKPVDPPKPLALNPTHGPAAGGYAIVVTGTGFQDGCTVWFDEAKAPSVAFFGSGVLTVTVPKGTAGKKVDVTVANPDGQTGTLTAAFTWDLAQGESVTIGSVSPSSGPVSGGTSVAVTGTGFSAGTQVSFGLNPAATTFVSSSKLVAVTPAGAEGLVDVIVKRPDNVTAIAYNAFTYVGKPGPSILAATPAVGPKTGGTFVLIEGDGFAQGAKVWFGPNAAKEQTVLSQTRIVAETPAGETGSVAVAVANPDGSAGTLSGAFTYYESGTAAPPLVFSVEPYQGSALGGDKVTVFGKGFKAGLQIFFCKTPAVLDAPVQDNRLYILTPPGNVGTCDVVVVNPDGLTGLLPDGFKYLPSPPVPTGIVPSAGPKEGGTSIVIKGSGFMSGATVQVGGADATDVEFWSVTTLKAVTPPGPEGKADVVVINPGGVSGTLSGAFTYTSGTGPGTPPTLDAVVPDKGPPGGGTPVELRGSGFQTGALVLFGTTVIQGATIASPTLIRATTPKGAPGPVDVTVLNPDGLGVTKNAGFTYETPVKPAPSLIGMTPNSGPSSGGTTVTMTGANLQSGAAFYLAGKPVLSLAFVNPSLVTGRTPAGTGVAELVYVGPDGQTATLPSAFTYTPGPTLDRVEPTVGPMAGGREVTLYGTNFAKGVKAFFGTREAGVVALQSEFVLIVSTPQAATPGLVDVSVRNTDGQSALLAKAYEYLAPPALTGVAPGAGPESGGTLVTLTGTGFYPTSQAFFGESAATDLVYLSPTRLVAATPAHVPGKVSVSVKNADGGVSVKADAFTYVAGSGLGPAPVVSDVAPLSGPETGGTPVTVVGDHFQTGAWVKFGPYDGTDTVVLGPKALLVTAPAAPPGKVKMAVMNPDGQVGYATSLFTFLATSTLGPAPKIGLIDPTTGPTKGGTVVTITGTGFSAGAVVLFGDETSAGVDVVSETEIRAVAPAHAKGKVGLVVVNPDGQSAAVADAFTFLAPPQVVAIAPKAGPAAGGTAVQITGAEFIRGTDEASSSRVLFCADFAKNTECQSVPYAGIALVDDSHLKFSTPAHTAGMTDVAVVNPDGQSGVLVKAFTFNPLPVITALSPASGSTLGNTQVTISGSGFQEGAIVTFGTTSAKNVVVAGPGTIVCATPIGTAGKADVTVTNPDGGKAVLEAAYTYIAPPTVTRVTPTFGPETGGISVTIEGSGFTQQPDSKVFFGPVQAAEEDTVVQSASMITVKAPPGKGAVAVKILNPDGQSASLDAGFTYIPPVPPPTISYVLPNKGSTLGGYAVQVVGNNYMDGCRVYFGKPGDWTEGINPVVKNAGTLVVMTAPTRPAGKVDVRVRNTDGQEGTKEDAFEFVPPQSQEPLAVVGIEPNRGMVSGGQEITISGKGFKAGIQVAFGKSPDWVISPTVNYVGSTLITVKVPPAYNGLPGKVDVRVANVPTPLGQEVVVVTDGFTYVPGAVFQNAPGHRLPPEPHDKTFSLVFDANNDGLNDVFVARSDTNMLLVNTPNPQGQKGWFQLTFPFSGTTTTNPSWAATGDFDEDGDTDLLLWHNQMILCKNNSTGKFTCASVGSWNCSESRFAVADLNCDGHLDVFVPRVSTSTSCPNFIMVGDGKGSFTARTDVLPAHYENSRAVALADVDRDGDVDALVANDDAMQKRLYFNNCNNITMPPACALDIPGYTMADYGGHRYAFSNETKNWTDAENKCAEYGFHLVTVNDSAEKDFLNGKFPSDTYWIGYSDLAGEGEWKWVSGTSTYTNWCSKQPDGGTNENCAQTSTSTGRCWYDYSCNNSYKFVCESVAQKCTSTWKFADALYGEGKNFPISGGNSKDVAFADIDGNGYPDAIVANWGQQTAVYLNIGGNFQLDDGFHWPQYEANPYVSRLWVADLDLDGDLDVAAFVKDGIRVYRNDLSQGGVGLLTDVSAETLPSLTGRGDLVWISLGDLDGDLLPDLFWTSGYHTDRLMMNNGFTEGKTWQDANRVGFGKFAFNTFAEVPELVKDGVGAAFGDINGDGFLDLVQGGAKDRLYVYIGKSGRWVDETATRMPTVTFDLALNGLILVDLNKDNDLDIVGTRDDYHPVELANDGKGVFTDVSALNIPDTAPHSGGLAAVDLDQDGDPDLVFGVDYCYYSCYGSKIYVNGGDIFNNGGAFLLDKTATWWPSNAPTQVRAVAVADFNYDKQPDLYLGMSGQNRLYLDDAVKNLLTDSTVTYLPAISDDTRDVLVMDFDADGDKDIFVANWGQSRFHIRESLAKFADATTSALPALSLQTQGVAGGDLDLDGMPEIVMANYEQKNTLLGNLGGDRFTNLSANLPEDWDATRHVFLLDVDGDGDLDIYVVNKGQDRLYVNTTR